MLANLSYHLHYARRHPYGDRRTARRHKLRRALKGMYEIGYAVKPEIRSSGKID